MEHEQIEAEFQRMHQALLDEPEQGKFKELFQGVNRKRTALIFGMGTFQQITGQVSESFVSTTRLNNHDQAFASQYAAVFIKGLGTINPFAMSLGNSCIASFGIICTLLTVDKIGRRYGDLPFPIPSAGTFDASPWSPTRKLSPILSLTDASS